MGSLLRTTLTCAILAAASSPAWAGDDSARDCPFCDRALQRRAATGAAAAHYLCGRCSTVVHVHADGRETVSRREDGIRRTYTLVGSDRPPLAFPAPGSAPVEGLEGRAGHPVERPGHPVDRPDHPVTRGAHPVERPAHAVERPDHPVGRPDHAIERPDHAVERPAHAVERPAHAVERSCHPVGRPSHPVIRGGHPVTRGGHPVTRSGSVRSGETNFSYRSPVPRSAPIERSAPIKRAPPARQR